jgi:hypothetical protein
MTTVAGLIALCLSAMSNRNLLRQVSDDLHKYTITPMSDSVAKSRYLLVLKKTHSGWMTITAKENRCVLALGFILANVYASQCCRRYVATARRNQREKLYLAERFRLCAWTVWRCLMWGSRG